ncbi:MAG: alkaline phosphatase D family protein [Rubrivivax sp.]
MLTLGAGLGAGLAPAFMRHARAADAPLFTLGVASGQPHAQGMVLWTRLMAPVDGPPLPTEVSVQWELAHDEGFTQIAARGSEAARAEDAQSVHAEPRGLAPGRGYFYRFSALGQRSATGRTRTAPAPGDAATLDFAIASCQRWDHGHFAAWRHAAEQPLDLVLFLGDYIYEYGNSGAAVRPNASGLVRTLDQYRARYAQYKADPALQAAHAAAPWLLVWDDHEVENDYAGLQGQSLQAGFAAQRAAAYQAYWEHLPLPKAARPVDGELRLFGRLDWGRLARVHLLDDRQYRDPQVCARLGRGGSNVVALKDCPDLLNPQRSLLGAAQERWLAEGWDLQRPWNLLAQQTLMARFSGTPPEDGGGTYWTDGWDGYPAARQRLLATVADRRVPGVVVLGGDVHAHHVADLKADFDDPKAPVLAAEFCGTSISSRGPSGDRLAKSLPLNPHMHLARGDVRGYVRFQLNAQTLQAQLMAVQDPLQPDSAVHTLARCAVDAKRPGVLKG